MIIKTIKPFAIEIFYINISRKKVKKKKNKHNPKTSKRQKIKEQKSSLQIHDEKKNRGVNSENQ
jgi:hypothetical protein